MSDTLHLSPAEVLQRKAFLEFAEMDVALLKELHELLDGHASFFVEDFYQHLLAFEETRHLLQDDARLDRLKQPRQPISIS